MSDFHLSVLAGASAGVYALIAAHLATLILNWKVAIIYHLFFFIINQPKEDGHIYDSRRKKEKEVPISMAPMVRY